MAMPPSLTPLLLLTLSAIPAALAIRPTTAGGDSLAKSEEEAAKSEFDDQMMYKNEAEQAEIQESAPKDPLAKACLDTAVSDLVSCVELLKTFPDAAAASPRRRAEMAFQYVLKQGQELAVEAQRAVAAPAVKEDPKLAACLQPYDDRMGYYMSNITGLAPEKSDAKFAEAKEKLWKVTRADLGDVSLHCTVKHLTSNPITEKVDKFGGLIFTAAGLMQEPMTTTPAGKSAEAPAGAPAA